MKVCMFSHTFLTFIILMNVDELLHAEFFLVTPRRGDSESVYSPVDVNATLHCAVNNTNLQWTFGRFTVGNEPARAFLNSRGVFQTTWTSLNSTTHSTLTVFGNVVLNNMTHICCQSFVGTEPREICTILIIYERPSPPEGVSVQYTGIAGLYNISWTATTVMGVDQNYTIFFKPHKAETTQLHYIHQLSRYATICGEFLAFITAVNGAGESDPSNNVTIPSLPDIGPVTASLSHQVWKSTGGEIMVNVSFKLAKFCVEYPLINYLLVLRGEPSGKVISVSLNSAETKVTVVLSSQDGLEENQMYVYTVTAVNSVGNVTTDSNQYDMIVTSDLQSVTAMIVGESTIDIQCLFIHGSDAVGCKVVLVSNCTNIKDKDTHLLKTDRFRSATGNLSLSHNISCYHLVSAYEIDINNTIINFTIEGRINPMVDGVAKGSTTGGNWMYVTIAVLVTAFLLVVIIVMAVFSIRKLGNKRHHKSTNVALRDYSITTHKNDDSVCQPPLYCELTQLSAPTTHSTSTKNTSTAYSLPVDSEQQPLQQSSVFNSPDTPPQTSAPNVTVAMNDQSPKEDIEVKCIDNDTDTTAAPNIPVYAIPEKLKQKLNKKCQDVQEVQNEEEHFYHILESDRETSKANSSESDQIVHAPDLPPPFTPDPPVPVYQDIKEISQQPCENYISVSVEGEIALNNNNQS